jgi:hypothetical protein
VPWEDGSTTIIINSCSQGITGKDNITKTLKKATNGETVTFLFDTEAYVNILPITEYIQVTADRRGKKLNKSTTTTIRTYGGKSWTSQVRTELAVVVGTKLHKIPIIVINVNAMPLLSSRTSESLGLVKVLRLRRSFLCDQVAGRNLGCPESAVSPAEIADWAGGLRPD